MIPCFEGHIKLSDPVTLLMVVTKISTTGGTLRGLVAKTVRLPNAAGVVGSIYAHASELYTYEHIASTSWGRLDSSG